MTSRDDGSAGDVNYGAIGHGYATYRRPDPHIAARIMTALGEARWVLNVGAGAGSYEPRDRIVTAVEPSATMRAQRPPDLPAAIDAVAENLPFADREFDAAMATVTVHQWRDLAAGISELRRVTTGPIVILTADPDRLFDYWLYEYFPEPLAIEQRRFPPISRLVELLGPTTVVEAVDVPLTCTDGFSEAYYGRPEMLLDAGARGAMSSYTLVEPGIIAASVARLRADLDSGAWDERHGHLRTQPFFRGSLRLVIRQ